MKSKWCTACPSSGLDVGDGDEGEMEDGRMANFSEIA